MTDPAHPAAAAPGWYPDASGQQRWWDGRGWTEHVAAPAVTALAQRPQLPEGTKVDTAWIWVVALATFVSCIPLFFFDFAGYMRATMALGPGDSALASPASTILAFYAITWTLGLLVWALQVVGAYRDYRHLLAIGVVRPFHWAFAFIPYALVYLIGRHVVVRKTVRTAGAPLWTHVALLVLTTIGIFVWMMVVVVQIMNEFSTMYPYGSYS